MQWNPEGQRVARHLHTENSGTSEQRKAWVKQKAKAARNARRQARREKRRQRNNRREY